MKNKSQFYSTLINKKKKTRIGFKWIKYLKSGVHDKFVPFIFNKMPILYDEEYIDGLEYIGADSSS